jgi:hypothetical protein
VYKESGNLIIRGREQHKTEQDEQKSTHPPHNNELVYIIIKFAHYPAQIPFVCVFVLMTNVRLPTLLLLLLLLLLLFFVAPPGMSTRND